MGKSIDPVQRLIDWLKRLERRIKALETAPTLQNTSVTKGRLRFIGGQLLIDEGGNLTVVGTFDVNGVATVSGRLSVEGAGVLTVSSLIDLLGDMRVREGGSIHVGDMIIDESDGGSVTFPSGAKIAAFEETPGVVITSGSAPRLIVTNGSIALLQGADEASVLVDGPVARVIGDVVQINASNRLSFGIPTGDASDAVAWMARDATGRAFWVDAATGGPTGSGEFAWPFDLSLVTKEYDPLDPGYDNGHLGIDFGSGIANVTGTPIPAAANGTVLANGWDSERGWYVILDHGTRGTYALTTRYYHLNAQSPLAEGAAVTKGDSLGGIGSTGMSTGPHLHFETRRNGAAMNPRTFMSIYGE